MVGTGRRPAQQTRISWTPRQCPRCLSAEWFSSSFLLVVSTQQQKVRQSFWPTADSAGRRRHIARLAHLNGSQSLRPPSGAKTGEQRRSAEIFHCLSGHAVVVFLVVRDEQTTASATDATHTQQLSFVRPSGTKRSGSFLNKLLNGNKTKDFFKDIEWRKAVAARQELHQSTFIRRIDPASGMKTGSNNNNGDLVGVSAAAAATTVLAAGQPAVSRSFTFQTAGGVRRKIPISPVLSTSGGSSGSAGNSRHDTLHYR